MANELNPNKKTMSSLEIAELAGRNHKDVMRSIRDMEPAWVKVNGRNFALVEYKDAKGETRPCYELHYDECMYVASKFNDETRAKLVVRWRDLETGKAEPIISLVKNRNETANHIRQDESCYMGSKILELERELKANYCKADT